MIDYLFITGDSHTTGHELSDNVHGQKISKYSWGEIFKSSFLPNCEYRNTSESGSSMDHLTNKLIAAISKEQNYIKNGLCIVMGTHHNRYTFFNSELNAWDHYGTWLCFDDYHFSGNQEHLRERSKFLYRYLHSAQMSFLNYKKNVLLIQSLCNSLNMKMLFIPIMVDDFFQGNVPTEAFHDGYHNLINKDEVVLFENEKNFSHITSPMLGWYEYATLKKRFNTKPKGHLCEAAHEHFALKILPLELKNRHNVIV